MEEFLMQNSKTTVLIDTKTTVYTKQEMSSMNQKNDGKSHANSQKSVTKFSVVNNFPKAKNDGYKHNRDGKNYDLAYIGVVFTFLSTANAYDDGQPYGKNK